MNLGGTTALIYNLVLEYNSGKVPGKNNVGTQRLWTKLQL